jgi:hypothetical protein
MSLASWSPMQVAAMKNGIARAQADDEAESVAEVDQCVNFGALECVGRAEPNGWCSGCWARIDPGSV